uniref:Zinc finger protein 687b n=1 Tax=Salmo trutta TaxID=8032 RepID=A0A674DC16_SALTR
MGDMKTPDFDDLLAAFDIPDIDAKEAIQSAPDEAEGPHGPGGAPLGKPDGGVGVGPSLRPPSPPDPQADTPIVSVIVKNRVRPDTIDGGDGDTDQDTMDGIAGVAVGPRLGACAPGMAESEPLNHNGFGASGVTPPLTQAHAQSNGEPWSVCTPKTASEGDDEGKASLSSSSSVESAPLVPGVSVGLSSPFFPPSKPLLLSASSPFNGAPKAGPALFSPRDSEEDDSDPDLGPPLLIQEPPDSPSRTPPKLARRFRSPAVISDSTHPMASSAAHPKPGDTPSGTSVTSSTPQSGSTKSPPQEDKHPEHVIEERDSPESPEPEIPKLAAPVTAKRCSSPAVASTPPPSDLQEPKEEEEEMEVGNGIEKAMDGKADFVKEEGARTGEEKMEMDDGKSKPPTTEGGTSIPGGPAAPARPLKVRIKTIKTSSGGITRTVTRVAPKAGAAGAKSLDPSKAHQGGRKAPANRSRKPDTPSGRMVASQPQKVKSLNTLPVSTLAASSAMLVAATKAQNKMAASSDKAMVSATAVSFTKSATLPAAPSVSSPKFSVATGGLCVRPVSAKTANGGTTSVLAGTHQPNKPASIVNSTGAVISRSQSSLVEAFNKILNSKNLLPSYKPDLSALPPPEWGLPLPATGYRCLECGDAFALERSLARHYDRRSLRIEVTCNHCAKRLAFFNKCSLLLHAREHKERGLVMQCSHLVMRPVNVEQMIGQQDTAPIGKSPQALMPLPCKKGEVLQYHNFKCPECQAQFSGKAELVAHFQQIRATPNSTCTLCSPPMMLPNWCSVSAHQRIHKHRAPHVCPECGGIARQASFQTHLEEACLHFARRIGYRCSSCQVVFGGLNSIKSHIQTAHCEVFHKCPSCPMAFKSAPSAQGHISTQHPTLTGGQAKMIYKCVMCDTVFTQKPLLYMHFDTHLAKQKVHVFKCPDCTKLYAQKGSMMEHIKGQSDATAPATAPTNPSTPSPPKSKPSEKTDNSDGEDWEGDEDYEKPENQSSSMEAGSHRGTPSEWSCQQCQKSFTQSDDYISHMKTEHGKAMKKFLCRVCESSFCTSSSLRRHVRVIHEGNKRVFHCQYCTEDKRTFSSRLILEKHIQVHHHGVRSTDGQVRGGTDSGDATEEGGSPVKRTRASAPPEPVEADNACHCVPCGFATEDAAEFQRHIPQHRADAASFQCLQCGVCFASAGSLGRHRFITHRVRDPQGESDRRPPRTPSSPDGSPSSPLEGEDGKGSMSCRVCRRRFNRASDLNTHLRTHGMAFITAHKTDKPQ